MYCLCACVTSVSLSAAGRTDFSEIKPGTLGELLEASSVTQREKPEMNNP